MASSCCSARTLYIFSKPGDYPSRLGMVAAPFVVGAIGFLLERTIIRRFYAAPIVAILGTYALGVIIRESVRGLIGGLYRAVPEPLIGSIDVAGVHLSRWRFAIIVITIVVMIGSYLLLKRTSFGLRVRAALENPALARASGISTNLIYAITFAFGAALGRACRGAGSSLVLAVRGSRAALPDPGLSRSNARRRRHFRGPRCRRRGRRRRQCGPAVGRCASPRRCIGFRVGHRLHQIQTRGSVGREEYLTMTSERKGAAWASTSRRRFLQSAAWMAGTVATGIGSWVIRPDWANAASRADQGRHRHRPHRRDRLCGQCGRQRGEDADQGYQRQRRTARPPSGALSSRTPHPTSSVAVTNVRKLIQRDKVDVVLGGITSSMRNAIKDTIVKRGQDPLHLPAALRGPGVPPYLFCTGPTPAQQCDTSSHG